MMAATQQRLYRMTPPHTATVEWPGHKAHHLKHIVYHSPTGFSWGYGGSGPADLALSLLADHLGELRQRTLAWSGEYQHWLRCVEKTRAWALHQDFKWQVVAPQPMDQVWQIDSAEIAAWITLHSLTDALTDEAAP